MKIGSIKLPETSFKSELDKVEERQRRERERRAGKQPFGTGRVRVIDGQRVLVDEFDAELSFGVGSGSEER